MTADFATIGLLLSSPARSRMLNLLLRGQAFPASELSHAAGVALSTGSEHLAELTAGGLTRVEVHGRHRYYSLAGPKVAEALESVAGICEAVPVRSLGESIARERLRRARTCYDHLAGMVGVAMLDSMLAQGLIERSGDDCLLTVRGQNRLTRIGIDVDQAKRAHRTFARLCLDWTERRHHLGGALGAAISGFVLERGWLQRTGSSRALSISPTGCEQLGGLGVPKTIINALAS
jgi:DNA-binding transcriptional ArsR family regulator